MPVAGLERMTTGSAVSVLSYRATQELSVRMIQTVLFQIAMSA